MACNSATAAATAPPTEAALGSRSRRSAAGTCCRRQVSEWVSEDAYMPPVCASYAIDAVGLHVRKPHERMDGCSLAAHRHPPIHTCIHSFWSSHLLLGRVYSLSQHGQRMQWWWLGKVPESSLSTCESSRCRPPPVVVAVASSDRCRRDLLPCTAMLLLDLYSLILPTYYLEH